MLAILLLIHTKIFHIYQNESMILVSNFLVKILNKMEWYYIQRRKLKSIKRNFNFVNV